MARTATIRDVELVSVGTFAASTGVTKVTRADLDAMLAAHADKLVDHAPIKLGHRSPLNDDLGDGAPAYGWVVPTSIRPNSLGVDTLVGDLVGMPSALAEVAPTAYRRRSVEIAWGLKTAGGKTYTAALVGIALLGVQAPAVKGLEDVLALYSAEPEVDRVTAIDLVDGLEDNTIAVAMLTAARLAGAPVAQLDLMAAAAGARDTADVPPPIADPDHDEHEQQTNPPAPPAPPTGRTTMTDEELRAALNIEATADINAELARILSEREPVVTDPAAVVTDPPAAVVTDPPAGPAAPAEPQLVTLSAATYSELTAAAATIADDRRKRTLDDAVRQGRIAPAERGNLTSELAAGETVSGFAAALERDEQGTTTLLAGLSPRFPVTELAHDSAPNAHIADAAYDRFDAETFGIDRS